MRACSDLPGVLPLLDAVQIVDGLPVERPWLVSAIATPIAQAVGLDTSLADTVRAVQEIAGTLAAMHARDISHRDVKPDNLFLLEGRWCIGDLGLAAYEDLPALTEVGERLGPTFYIAAEMLNAAHAADGKKADVFSLAKTLWKLATGQAYPIPSAYARGEVAFSLASYVALPRANLLDPLISLATDHDPNKRPSMQEFADGLRHWLAPSPSPRTVGPIALDVDRFRGRVESVRAQNEARVEVATLREAQRKAIDARWVGAITVLSERLCESLEPAPFDNIVSHPADILNCGASVDAWIDLTPSGARATLRLIYNFHAYEHPRCWFAFVVAIQFSEGAGADNTETLLEKRWPVLAGSDDELRVTGELNALVDDVLQAWVEAVFDRVEAYAIHLGGSPR